MVYRKTGCFNTRSQNGHTNWSKLTFILLLGFAAFLTFKMTFVYLDHSIIRGSMQSLVNGSDFPRMTKRDIQRSISKRLNIDGIRDFEKGSIKLGYDRVNKTKFLTIKYSKKVPLFSNISACIDFDENIYTVRDN